MAMNPTFLTTVTVVLTLMLANIFCTVQAEDTEIFFTNEDQLPPNVLFILDTSGSMNVEVSGTDGQTRMEVLQGALSTVLSRDYEALNVGIMDFNKDRGGGIDFPIADINSDAHSIDSDIPEDTTVGQVLGYITDSYTPSGKTPIGDALYQASSYFMGSRIYNTWRYYGKPKTWDTDSNSYTGGYYLSDHPEAYEGGTWYEVIPDSESTVTEEIWEWCYPGKPASESNSCLHTKYDRYDSCSTVSGAPRRCRLREKVCDATGIECSWAWAGSLINPCPEGSEPVDPDGSGSDWYVHIWNAYSGYERCKGYRTTTTTTSSQGFDTIPTYKSPIEDQCQSNYVVLLSDGEPTRRGSRNNIAKRVEPITGDDDVDDCSDLSDYGEFIAENGRCLPELTKYMREEDLAPEISGDQTVTTYTVGFGLDGNVNAQNFLRLLSDENHGQGEYFDATSPDELANVFQGIINTVTDANRSFVAPSVSISQDNRLATSEYVYMSSFTPSDRPSWEGDITRYRVNASGFTKLGGMASLLTNTRNVYTYTDSSPPADSNLTIADNRVIESNDELTWQLLGLDDDEDRTDIIRWARGIDSADQDDDDNVTEAHTHMGDPLHTKPVLISYSDRDILYSITNDGYLHAFDVSAATPYELFAFIPQELLPNLEIAFNNSNSDSKIYGLDGGITVWQTDEKITLYISMRRGGRNYYALDITDPTVPKLKWVIQGGVTTGFEELGQSWSIPVLTKVKKGSDKKMALIFGGGYDVNQDGTTTRSNDTIGRAIFIVDAETGTRLWSAGPAGGGHDLTLTGLDNSIPSNIRALDLNGNGLVDRLYFGDTGGRVWRIDLDETNVANSTGYQLADINSGDAAGNRRFYYAPSVAFTQGGQLMLTIGSGYRAHPLATGVQDRFYAFEDVNAAVGSPATTPTVITESILSNVTDQATLSTDKKTGWYLNMGTNEKVLEESLIFNDHVTFTTYMPEFGGSGDDTCNLVNTQARAYSVRLSNGNSGLSDTFDERTVDLEINSIPGSPYIVFNDPGDDDTSPIPPGEDNQTADLYVGTQMVGQIGQVTERMFWIKNN